MAARRTALSALAALALLAAGCVNPNTGTSAGTAAPSASSSGSASAAASSGGQKRIGFFGFARANSFSSATFAGVEEYAAAHGATAEFLDPNFDAQTQVQQLQDAVTSKRFDVFVVQANDGAAVVPAVRAAVSAGIAVVVQFTPVGTRYDTADPQVEGTITLVDVPTRNGETLGRLGVEACRSRKLNPCQVAFLEGMKALPLDNARTEAALAVLKGAPGVEVKAQVEGGYTQESGRKAMQDVLQKEPGIDVVIGASQAVAGAEAVAKGKDVLFVANGGSRQTVKAVQEGRWYAAYYLPVKTLGAKAAELGLGKAQGLQVPAATVMTDVQPGLSMGTKEALAKVTGEYDE
ncbi:sugar ABC transporter substrate-binding protein [Nonomuraea pusilla]|uniref:Ribose transport system substrate-binding protein n=1 Tax=Nonomuraea pusilla TaxID=46177 RepID=A0A1H7YZZ7_9ACTN|nr:sugar ABC transporter substrate-binding protein [Nonomuraea pusilla]SEM50827.1 ribose transport system substrate-binding protein [Nonomuraea pusilla]